MADRTKRRGLDIVSNEFSSLWVNHKLLAVIIYVYIIIYIYYITTIEFASVHVFIVVIVLLLLFSVQSCMTKLFQLRKYPDLANDLPIINDKIRLLLKL